MARQAKLPAGMVRRGDTYYANFMHKGQRVRKRLSTDLDAAKVRLNELRADADLSENGPRHNRHPWAELKKSFLLWARQHVKHWKEYERDLKNFERFGAIVSCHQVTAEHVYNYRTWRLEEGVSRRTVNKEVSTVKNMLNKGVDRFHVLATNPIAQVNPLEDIAPRKVRRSLSAAEVGAIFEHSPPDLLPVFRLIASTGIRRREAVKLTFDDIDWDLQTITIQAKHAKNKRERTIPIDDATAAMLVGLRELAQDRPEGADRERVFVNCLFRPIDNNLLRRFYSVCRRAGIPDAVPGGAVDLHSLRVTYATLTLEGGANPKAIQSILGHSTLEMTMSIYAKATDQSKRAAIAALPWASEVNPRGVVSLPDKGAKVAQIYPKSKKGAAAG